MFDRLNKDEDLVSCPLLIEDEIVTRGREFYYYQPHARDLLQSNCCGLLAQ